MTLIYMFLNLMRQFQLMPPEKVGEFQLECEEWEKTAVRTNTEDSVKKGYGDLHYGKYGIVFRMLMPVIYLFVRKYLVDYEKGDDESLLD